VTNVGGPGASGLGFPAYLVGQFKAEHLGTAASGYDWIGFDPRGVGSSVPAITCDPNYFSPGRRDYNPRTKAVLRYWQARTADYAADCAEHGSAQTAPSPGTCNTAPCPRANPTPGGTRPASRSRRRYRRPTPRPSFRPVASALRSASPGCGPSRPADSGQRDGRD